ncbi:MULTISPECIES: AlpA family transcriptional regulator [Burkholderia cepacia complex]|uniref:helix-turn-helix transcriptional regulator n=1 Tax=Burkholderia cepacia complex TaxID=87882 RepID=UPI001906B9DD|nr:MULTISPECIES: AlpA family phage regulatory protein [Burkholderia cepacia complex]MBK1820348.1 AlpA family phage regulatory protein [Burkholderia orbicola]MCA7966644.1 AlpA family phage regulatory protein [Burkholderia cenocepacia]MDR8058912.1 AlpA family phage regulatory protein [Burkholderia cenocepacia]MDR8060999.1 AlpA family phage regulatory protein [Burkholderia cenocepacia]
MATKDPKTATRDHAQATTPQSLPFDGFTRWSSLKHFIPLSHEAVRLRERAGRFPKRVQLGSARCVAWPNREIHRWLADPVGYRALESA